MDLNALVNSLMNDERLLAHLVGIHVVLLVILFASVALRKALKHGGDQFVRWTGLHWLDGMSREATQSMRAMLFWATLTLMGASLVSMAAYHVSGRDLRWDIRDWFANLTGAQLLAFGLLLGKLIGLAVGVTLAFRLVRRVRVSLERYVGEHLPRSVPEDAPAEVLALGDRAPRESRLDHDEKVRSWFWLLERAGSAAVILGGVWAAGRLAHVAEIESTAVLRLKVLTIVTAARLLALSGRTLTCVLAGFGNRHLGKGRSLRYWERVTRLFPFGERCFEAAVYVSAASLCMKQLNFIAFVADYGESIVKCIGIFFGTRVLIELLYVLIFEAFGMYDEDRPIDQKGQTLVPLLQSICQYVLYFGAGIYMLDVLGLPTTPILAGASILGLAGGLGAQSLVTDVVSGFFILFENQYLVGDIVQIGDAAGRVEAVSIRHTQIRDEQGKLYLIPNGQIKTVTNFSKGYVNAVVDVKVPTSANLEQVMQDMAEAGRRLRQARREVLGETAVKGLVDLTPTDMVVRAVTKVLPGHHAAMQHEYRRLLKEVLDERQARAQAIAPMPLAA
jgi:small conductance mechanosensitive channel